MSPETIKLCVMAAIAAVIFGTGWGVKGWKDSGEISRLEGKVETQQQSIATLEGANTRCLAGVKDVQAAVKGFIDAGTERSEAARIAMEAAAAAAQGHLAAAQAAVNRAAPAAGKECPTAAQEAQAYARKRKGAP